MLKYNHPNQNKHVRGNLIPFVTKEPSKGYNGKVKTQEYL